MGIKDPKKDVKKAGRREILSVTRDVVREYPKLFLLMTFLLACSSVLEILGTGFMVPLIANLFGSDLLQGSRLGTLLQKAGVAGLGIGSLLMFIVVFMGIRTALLYFSSMIAGKMSVDVERNIRDKIFSNVLSASWPFFIAKRTGTIVNMLTQESMQAGYAVQFMGRFYVAAILSLFFLSAAMFFSFKGFLLMVAVSGPLLLVGSRINRKTRTASTERISHYNAYNAQTIEALSQAKLWKSTDVTENAALRQRELTGQLARVQMKNVNYLSMMATVPDGFLLIVLVVIVAMSHWLQVSAPADFVLFLLLMFRAQRFVGVAQTAQQRMVSYMPSYVLCRELIAESDAAREKFNDTGVIPQLAQSVELKNINFSYKPDVPVLQDINISVPARKTIAFAGKSGSGKTTLVDLITGLLVPESGSITIDGAELNTVNLRAWRQKIAYVPQDPVLFNGTIRENIVRDAPESAVQFEEIARLSNIDEFVNRLPEGYETNVNDRGISLSGGQKQRVALARALMRNPEILILDEATSALDTISEDEIKKSLAALKHKMTIIVIAHRFSTIRDADMIYVIDEGRVAQQGTYGDLAQKPGTFAQLAQLSA